MYLLVTLKLVIVCQLCANSIFAVLSVQITWQTAMVTINTLKSENKLKWTEHYVNLVTRCIITISSQFHLLNHHKLQCVMLVERLHTR